MRSLLPGLAIATLAAACSDGGAATDAGPADAPVDAGPLELETQTVGLATGLSLAGVRVAEVGGANETTSAPNGRAVLTLAGGDTVVDHELEGYLANRMAVSAAALAAHQAARQPLLSELVVPEDLDDLYAGLGIVRDETATQVLVYLRTEDGSGPAIGATVDGDEPSLVRRAGGDFEVGDAVIDDPLVVIPNASGAELALAVPSGCTGVSDLQLAPGQIVSTFLVCAP